VKPRLDQPEVQHTYIRKKNLFNNAKLRYKKGKKIIDNVEVEMDLDVGQSTQNTSEDIGIQCELGSEIYSRVNEGFYFLILRNSSDFDDFFF
jgi:hypothetical protein